MRRGLLAALAAALLLGACSKSGDVEDEIAKVFASARNVKDLKVTCPGDVKANEGDEFDCTVKGDQLATISGSGTTEARIHVVFEKDNEFSVVSYTPTNGPNANVTQRATTSSEGNGTAS
jgi:hypothetical protein